ncbi:MAG: hypothetical protein Kow0068_14130 [Marinilabiliales bacterium]
MKQIKKISLFLLITLLLSGCFSGNLIIKPKQRTGKPKQITLKKLQSKIENAYLDYKYLQIKFAMQVVLQDKNYSLKGQIRINKDSIIWINLSHATNIPVARIIIQPDSLVFINKIASEYYKGDYSFIERYFQIKLHYQQLQALITNELFTYPDWDDIFDLKKGNYKDKIDSGYYCLKSIKDRKIKRMIKKDIDTDLIIQNIYIEPDSFKIERVNIYEYNLDRELDILYGNFNYFDSILLPELININFKTDSFSSGINIKYERIEKKEIMSFPGNINNKYTRIE